MTRTVSRREMLAWALAIIVAIGALAISPSNRAEAGKGGFPEPITEAVYLATGENFPDALALSTVAALGLGPVLLVQQNTIPEATMSELNRLTPSRIVIAGGTAVISDALATQLEALMYVDEVLRVAGANRYETAARISEETFPTSGLYPRAVGSRPSLPTMASGTPQVLSGASIVVPAQGMLIVNASATLSTIGGAESVGQCWLQISRVDENDNEEMPGTRRWVTLDADEQTVCATTVAVGIHFGEFEVTFMGLMDGLDAMFEERGVSVLWVPFDHRGAPPPTDFSDWFLE